MGDFVSRSEIKNILRITDGYVENESVTMSSMSPKKLTYKGNVNIIYVAADSDNSTVHTTFYTTNDYKTTRDAAGYTLIKRKADSSTIGDTQTLYVQYTYNQYDTEIDDLLPQIKSDIVEYLNNSFKDVQTQYSASHFQLLSSGKIRDTVQRFKIEGFQDDMDFILEGTERNKGIYTASSVTSEYITIDTQSTLLKEVSTDEYGGRIIQITRINWPVGLKKTIAKIIWANIDRAKSDNIKSKSIGPLSLSFNSLKSGGYDESVYNELRKYKNVRIK